MLKAKGFLKSGAGGGQCSIAFAKHGAKVTGIDLSKAQIRFAKELAKKEKVSVEFLLDNAEDLRRIVPNSMDIVFSAYALEYVKNLRKCFREAKRVLKNNGLFVFSFNHPVWDIFKFGTLQVEKSYFRRGMDVFDWKIRSSCQKRQSMGLFRRLPHQNA